MAKTCPGEVFFNSSAKLSERASISENVRRIFPSASKTAPRSRFLASVSAHAARRGSGDVVLTCEFELSRLSFALVFEHEGGHSSRLSRDRYGLRVRRGLSHPLDQTRH